MSDQSGGCSSPGEYESPVEEQAKSRLVQILQALFVLLIYYQYFIWFLESVPFGIPVYTCKDLKIKYHFKIQYVL